jgi:hypothetical protein
MLWKEHYRAAWPWETSVLATAGRVQRRDSSADAGTDGPEQHDVKKRSKSATAGHTFAVPHPRGVVGGTSSSQLNGSRKRKADEVASNKEGGARVDSIEKEKREKRGRLSATADEAFGSPVMGETDDDEMVVTVSPHLAGALETSDTHKPRSDGAHDILSRVFNINRKQHGLEIGTALLTYSRLREGSDVVVAAPLPDKRPSLLQSTRCCESKWSCPSPRSRSTAAGRASSSRRYLSIATSLLGLCSSLFIGKVQWSESQNHRTRIPCGMPRMYRCDQGPFSRACSV